MNRKKTPRPTPQKWSKSILEEIRGIRREEDTPSAFANVDPTPSLGCDYCDEVGDHVCLPTLFAAIEASDEVKEYCWRVYEQLRDAGHLDVDTLSQQGIKQ